MCPRRTSQWHRLSCTTLHRISISVSSRICPSSNVHAASCGIGVRFALTVTVAFALGNRTETSSCTCSGAHSSPTGAGEGRCWGGFAPGTSSAWATKCSRGLMRCLRRSRPLLLGSRLLARRLAMMMAVVRLREPNALAAHFHASSRRARILSYEQQAVAAHDGHVRQQHHLHGRTSSSCACSAAAGQQMRSGCCRGRVTSEIGPRLQQRRARGGDRSKCLPLDQ